MSAKSRYKLPKKKTRKLNMGKIIDREGGVTVRQAHLDVFKQLTQFANKHYHCLICMQCTNINKILSTVIQKTRVHIPYAICEQHDKESTQEEIKELVARIRPELAG